MLSLFYVFATPRRFLSSFQLLVNNELFHQSSFYLRKVINIFLRGEKSGGKCPRPLRKMLMEDVARVSDHCPKQACISIAGQVQSSRGRLWQESAKLQFNYQNLLILFINISIYHTSLHCTARSTSIEHGDVLLAEANVLHVAVLLLTESTSTQHTLDSHREANNHLPFV